MNKALNLFSNLLRALADQIDNINPPVTIVPPAAAPFNPVLPPDQDAPPAPAKRRGRPPGSTAAPPPVAETAAVLTEGTGGVGKAAFVEKANAILEKATGGKTYEELQTIIMPFVKGTWANPPQPRTADVKKAIAKYAPADWPAGTTFGLQALAALPQHHAAFEAEIAALAY